MVILRRESRSDEPYSQPSFKGKFPKRQPPLRGSWISSSRAGTYAGHPQTFSQTFIIAKEDAPVLLNRPAHGASDITAGAPAKFGRGSIQSDVLVKTAALERQIADRFVIHPAGGGEAGIQRRCSRGVEGHYWRGIFLVSLGNSGLPSGPRQFERRLAWVDRKGEVEPLPAPPRPYDSLALSPDGRQVAVGINSDTQELWIYDLARGTLTRLTSEGNSRYPLWTPDGKHLTYRATKAGFRNLFWRAADGTGAEERLTRGENAQIPYSWLPDGKWLAYSDNSPTTSRDIWMVRTEGERPQGEAPKPQPFLQTPFNEGSPAFSPDGHWLAYVSDESGRQEVYLQPFPGPGRKWEVSIEGGTKPLWARSGRELFYQNAGKMLAVEITTSPTFSAGKPRVLYEGPLGGDVSPDGQPFLALQPVEPEQPPTQINVVLNWFQELKRKVPVK